MAMESSSYDIAATMALMNMLKINLMERPEIYRSLLAMLCDYDPSDMIIRKKIIKYMKLMITDQMLLKCLLMSLPEDPKIQQKPAAKPIPKPDKILLPPNPHHNHNRNRRFRPGMNLIKSLKVKKQHSQGVPKKTLKCSTSSAASSHRTQAASTVSQATLNQGTSVVNSDFSTSHALEPPVDTKTGKVSSTKDDTKKAVSKSSMTRILQKSMVANAVSEGQPIPGQGHCHVTPQPFFSPVTLPFPYQGIPYAQHYPDLTGYPTGMNFRPVLPWQQFNMIQPGVLSLTSTSSFQPGDAMKSMDETCVDLSLNSLKQEPGTKPDVGNCQQGLRPAVSAHHKRILSANDVLVKQPMVYNKNVGIKCVSSSKNPILTTSVKNVPLKGPVQMGKVPSSGLDTSSLEALAELTSRIGPDGKPSDTKTYLGARKSSSTGSLSVIDSRDKVPCVLPERSSGIVSTKPVVAACPQHLPSSVRGSSGGCNTNMKDGEKVLMKSFPYSQEIKLPDGKYFLLNSAADKKILNVRSDQNPAICQRLNAPVHGVTSRRAVLDHAITGSKVIKINNTTTSNDVTSKPLQTGTYSSQTTISDLQNEPSAQGRMSMQESARVQSSFQPKCTITQANTGEKTCTIQVHNTVTNKLITELLRKRARSDYYVYGPSFKKARALSESQASSLLHKHPQGGKRHNSVDVYLTNDTIDQPGIKNVIQGNQVYNTDGCNKHVNTGDNEPSVIMELSNNKTRPHSVSDTNNLVMDQPNDYVCATNTSRQGNIEPSVITELSNTKTRPHSVSDTNNLVMDQPNDYVCATNTSRQGNIEPSVITELSNNKTRHHALSDTNNLVMCQPKEYVDAKRQGTPFSNQELQDPTVSKGVVGPDGDTGGQNVQPPSSHSMPSSERRLTSPGPESGDNQTNVHTSESLEDCLSSSSSSDLDDFLDAVFI